jgi:hypothetical protein
MGVQTGTDRVIARLAGQAHGIVTRRRLRSADVSQREIERRIARGSLIVVHRGVYRVGHAAPSIEATYLAGVLACGEGAHLAGHAAAHLLHMIEGSPPAPRVWAPTNRHVPGVVTRRCRPPLARIETTTYRGIPTTNPARTLLDLAPSLSLDALARAFHLARIRHGTTEGRVLALLLRHPKAPGRRNLETVLLGRVPVTLSELERRFRTVLAAVGLPLPDESNRRIRDGYVDIRYRDPPLTIELDSYGYHASRHQWELDRRREREAYARGDQHRRYTYGDVFEDPSLMVAELRALLTSRSSATARGPRARSRRR